MVPVTILEDDKEVPSKVPVLDVHELLDYLHSELKLQCPLEHTQRFWTHLRDHDQPFAKLFPGTTEHVPFSLFGDEVCLGDPKDKCTGIFLSLTLFKPKHVRENEFLLFALQDEMMVHENLKTLQPILKHIVWSCNIAFAGRYPSCDGDGGPLQPSKQAKAGQYFADGRRYACAELKGDWKWHERVLRLRDTPTSKKCCFLCDATADDSQTCYYALGDEAGWATTQVSTASFIASKVRPGVLSSVHDVMDMS